MSLQGQFKQELEVLWDENLNLILDLDNLQYIDSSGVGSLAWFHRKIKASQKLFILCNVKPAVQNIFQMILFHRLVQITESVEEAIAECGVDNS
jgi:anti-anti-sigma factor